jgi:hypothetical protein
MPLPTKNRSAKARLRERAIAMHQSGWTQIAIARELGVHDGTIRRWLRLVGVPPKKSRYEANPSLAPDDPDPLATALAADLKSTCQDVAALARADVREEERQAIVEVAQQQASPGDQYQAYIAAATIKHIRDSIPNLPPIRTIKDLDTADQIARRSLGLNAKGGGQGKLTIDISILNNTKTRPAKAVLRGNVQDAVYEESADEEQDTDDQ